MIMIKNNETASKIMTNEVFKNASVRIAGQFNIPLDEAKADLMYEIANHRGVLQVVGDELTAHQLAHINYAKKDILRSVYNQNVKEQELFMPAETDDVNLIDLNFDDINITNHVSFSKGEIERVIAVLPMIYEKRAVPKIVELLTVGENQYKENHPEIAQKDFNRQLKRWIAIANKPVKRELIENVLFTDKELIEKKNRQLAQSFLDMVEQGSDKEWFDTWFKIIEDNEWFDEAFDFIKNPKNMMENWDMNTQARLDGYEFVKELNYLLNEE